MKFLSEYRDMVVVKQLHFLIYLKEIGKVDELIEHTQANNNF